MHKIVAHIRTAENGTDGDAARTNRGDRSIAGNAQTLPGQYREVRNVQTEPTAANDTGLMCAFELRGWITAVLMVAGRQAKNRQRGVLTTMLLRSRQRISCSSDGRLFSRSVSLTKLTLSRRKRGGQWMIQRPAFTP